MVRDEFDESFERLRVESNRLAQTERSADNFDAIVEQRVRVDRLRDEVTDARKNIVSRYEPPATEVVEATRGRQHTRLLGKIGALVAVALIATIVLVFFSIVRMVGDGFPISVEQITETVTTDGDTCRWRVQAIVRNDGEQAITVTQVETVLDRRFVRSIPFDQLALAPGQSAPLDAQWTLPRAGSAPCPDAADVDHGRLIMQLDNATSLSRSF